MTMLSSKDENRDLGKQIGCMNGIFQIFDRHRFLTGRGVGSKRLLQVQGGQHQVDQQYAIKSVVEKGVEVQREKPRISTKSSFSPPSSSSTFSPLDLNRTIQTETLPLRQISVPFQTSKECQPHDLRDSMQREVRRFCMQPQNSDVGRGTLMKHIDPPRPLHNSKTEKPKARDFAKDEGPTLPRFSYDSRVEVCGSAMKHVQVPRLSLDSKTSSLRALESRSSSLQSNQEPGSHNRISSVVARLMGLEALPDTTSTDESRTPSMRSRTEETLLSELSSRATEHVRNPTTLSRFPVEPRQPGSSQDSPKMAYKSRKAAATSTLHQTCSAYGQIEKRITDLEFKKSGKDLRALKQIRETRMEDKQGQSAELTSQRRCSLEERCPHQISNFSMRENEYTFQTRTPRYHKKSPAHTQKLNNLTPQNISVNNHTRHLPTELDRAFMTTQRMKVKNFTIPGRSSGAVSPRIQQNQLRIEAGSGRAKKQGSRNLTKKDNESTKNKVKAKQLSELSRGETASVASESNHSPVSQSEAEVISPAYSTNANTRLDKNHVSTTRGEHIKAAENAANMLEQPSPNSVLDNSFYCEDSPSPVKKLSTVFQEFQMCNLTESPSPNGAEWRLQNLNHLIDSTRLDHNFKSNQKLENMRKSVQELSKEPHYESLNPAYTYINKLFLINPDMLEQTESTREVENGAEVEKSDKRIQKKIIFDLVDEILARKITSRTSQLKEVDLEMGRVSLEQVAADMKHHWVDGSGEIPAVVLDIERQIFKDLINEVMTGGCP